MAQPHSSTSSSTRSLSRLPHDQTDTQPTPAQTHNAMPLSAAPPPETRTALVEEEEKRKPSDDTLVSCPTANDVDVDVEARGSVATVHDTSERDESTTEENGEKTKEQETKAAAAVPPNGGSRAWLQVAGGFFVFFNIWGLPLAFGVFEAFYTTDSLSDHSASSIAWIGTMANFLLIFIGFISGPLFDLGYFIPMLLTGAVLNIIGIFMTSLCKTYWQVFLAQGVCIGLRSGLMYVPTLSLVAGAFTTKRPIALGLLACGIGLGAIVDVVVFQGLIGTKGFGYTVRALGYITLSTFAVAIPAILLGPLPSRPSTTTSPRPARSLIDRSALTDYPFLMYTLINVFAFLGYAVPLFYIPAYGQLATSTSTSLSYYLLAVASAASFFGRLFVSILAPKTGIMPLWTACGASSAIVAFAWIAVRDTKGLVAFSIVYGFCSGGLIALPASVLPFVCPDLRMLGTRMGMSWAPTAVSVLIGPPIAGALVNSGATGGGGGGGKVGRDYFLGVQIWAGVVLALGTAQTVYVWWLLGRKMGKVWF